MSRPPRMTFVLCALIHCAAFFSWATEPAMIPFENITLEMSLKPFKETSPEGIQRVCKELFAQWLPLTRDAKQISVLLWSADGSEILDYAGKLDDEFEWAKYIGGANSPVAPNSGPESLSLHERPYYYTDNPPVMTYALLKQIIEALRSAGTTITGKPIRIGATFDPGPEFAKSSFKYQRHPETCTGNTMGKGTFLCCYSVLHGDMRSYAAYPEGIPEGTPFGMFFGRQCQCFLTDLGFDYIWFSNGFGFGFEAWSVSGAIFNGETFDTANIGAVRDKIIDFWRLFREGCPSIPIETRGTNLSTGMDLASNGVPLRDLYRGDFQLEPPPNSPWAALNGDFGLELIAYMSKIAELPGDTYPFRYYLHDPWWLNSPWLDRYGREPHDIYLPMSVARIDAFGNAQRPTSLLFLTVDNSLGEMPAQVPNEVIPHILCARRDSPDAPGPFVWVYPFDEYHDMTFATPPRLEEVFFGDWFMRLAMNAGLPLNTVVSSKNAAALLIAQPERFRESVLVCPVPDADSPLQIALLNWVEKGGRVILYGPLAHAGAKLLDSLALALGAPISGDLEVQYDSNPDTLESKPYPAHGNIRPLTCGGGLNALLPPANPATHIAARAGNGQEERVIAMSRALPEWQGGRIAWLHGVNSGYYKKGPHLLATDDPDEFFAGENLARFLLQDFGYAFAVRKKRPSQRMPLVCIARADNGFFFSGYHPNTTAELQMRFPQGFPLLIGFETRAQSGRSTYIMPRAWHRECRVFIDGQDTGELSCVEQHSGQYGITRRLLVTGLNHATARIYPPEEIDTAQLRTLVNAYYPFKTGEVPHAEGDPKFGRHFIVGDVTGTLTIAW